MPTNEYLLLVLLYQLPAITLGLLLKRILVWPLAQAILFLPGTMLHEGWHWLIAFLTDGQPTRLSLIPKKASNGKWILGSVSISNLTWYNGLPIGLAPLMTPLVMVLLTPSLTHWQFSSGDILFWAISAPLWMTSLPSAQDMKLVFKSIWPILLVGILGAIGWAFWHYR